MIEVNSRVYINEKVISGRRYIVSLPSPVTAQRTGTVVDDRDKFYFHVRFDDSPGVCLRIKRGLVHLLEKTKEDPAQLSFPDER